MRFFQLRLNIILLYNIEVQIQYSALLAILSTRYVANAAGYNIGFYVRVQVLLYVLKFYNSIYVPVLYISIVIRKRSTVITF